MKKHTEHHPRHFPPLDCWWRTKQSLNEWKLFKAEKYKFHVNCPKKQNHLLQIQDFCSVMKPWSESKLGIYTSLNCWAALVWHQRAAGIHTVWSYVSGNMFSCPHSRYNLSGTCSNTRRCCWHKCVRSRVPWSRGPHLELARIKGWQHGYSFLCASKVGSLWNVRLC